MLSVALFYLLAVIGSARRAHPLPLYPESSLEPQEDLLQKLVAEVEDAGNADQEQRGVKTLYPHLVQQDGVKDTWNKGIKDSAQQDKFTNLVDDLKDVVFKLAAADRLRSQGFLRSEQSLPKTNKRACFWKYCVTN